MTVIALKVSRGSEKLFFVINILKQHLESRLGSSCWVFLSKVHIVFDTEISYYNIIIC